MNQLRMTRTTVGIAALLFVAENLHFW